MPTSVTHREVDDSRKMSEKANERTRKRRKAKRAYEEGENSSSYLFIFFCFTVIVVAGSFQQFNVLLLFCCPALLPSFYISADIIITVCNIHVVGCECVCRELHNVDHPKMGIIAFCSLGWVTSPVSVSFVAQACWPLSNRENAEATLCGWAEKVHGVSDGRAGTV